MTKSHNYKINYNPLKYQKKHINKPINILPLDVIKSYLKNNSMYSEEESYLEFYKSPLLPSKPFDNLDNTIALIMLDSNKNVTKS